MSQMAGSKSGEGADKDSVQQKSQGVSLLRKKSTVP